MARAPKAKGIRVPILGTSRKMLIKPSDKRYQRVVDGFANGESVCLVKVERVFHLFVYSQSELDALANIRRRE
jgi:hypothetical protein